MLLDEAEPSLDYDDRLYFDEHAPVVVKVEGAVREFHEEFMRKIIATIEA